MAKELTQKQTRILAALKLADPVRYKQLLDALEAYRDKGLEQKRIDRALLQVPGRYLDSEGRIPGLLLVVTDTGASWILRYYRSGKERWHGLGSTRRVSLKEARKKAKAVRDLLDQDSDPIDSRRATRAAKKEKKASAATTLTFKQAAKNYFDMNANKWSNRKHRDQFLNSLRDHAFPIIGDMLIASIGTPEVLRVLERPVEASRGLPGGTFWTALPTTASRVRGRIELVLAWATIREHRSGDNPARWENHLDQALPAHSNTTLGADGQVEMVAKHHGALPFSQVPALLAKLRQRAGTAARALEFAFLTVVRTSEALGAKWSEVDFTTNTWTLPPERIKSRRTHRVPLSTAAIAVLQALPREESNPFIFIGARLDRLPNNALLDAYKRLGVEGTVHGTTRSAFRDWCAERTNYPREVCEMALAHTVKDKTEEAYRRGDLLDKRRKLMEQWSRYCAQPIARDAKNVVALRGAADGQ
jgi:integrase